MFEKIKKMFFDKDNKRRNENLIAFLIILVITLIIINKILSEDESKNTLNENNAELVTTKSNVVATEVSIENENLKVELENILSKISGVGKVEVLLTYSETSSMSPLYNESTSSSVSTSSDGTTTETTSESKEIFTDSSDEAVIEKYKMPKLEGAIVIAQGAGDINVKSNIVSAVEATTGLLNHKIQVFEMQE